MDHHLYISAAYPWSRFTTSIHGCNILHCVRHRQRFQPRNTVKLGCATFARPSLSTLMIIIATGRRHLAYEFRTKVPSYLRQLFKDFDPSCIIAAGDTCTGIIMIYLIPCVFLQQTLLTFPSVNFVQVI